MSLALPGNDRWVLEIGFVPMHGSDLPEGAVVPSQLAPYEIAPLPEWTWIYRPGEPPCRATISGYESTLINEDLAGDRDTAGFEITAIARGCDAPSGTRGWAVAEPEELDSTCALTAATTREHDPLDDERRIARNQPPVPTPYDELTPQCDWDNDTRFGTFVNMHELVDAPMMALRGAFVLGGTPQLLLYIGSGAFAVAALDGEQLGRVAYTSFDDIEIGECGQWVCCCGC